MQWLFLGDLRSAIIVAAIIPFALSFAVVIFLIRGESANLLSVGAIDFGLIVDAAVIMVENIYRRLSEHSAPALPDGNNGNASLGSKLATIFDAAGEVNRAILFSAWHHHRRLHSAVHLERGGRSYFRPMAKTYAYALSGALLATFVVSPALERRPAAGPDGGD